MSSRVRRPLLALMSVLTLGLAAPAVDAAGPALEPIAAARCQAIGTTVSVLGTVSVQSGAFDAGFAIEGLVDGIYVLDAAGATRDVGDVVQVTGTLVDNFGLRSIQPTHVTTIAKRLLPVLPQPHSTASVGEATEGRLLSIHGEMVDELFDDSPYGYKFDIDDGSGPVQIFLYPGTGISTAGLVPGAHLHLTCFSNQFDTHYECDPRRPSDMHID